MRVSRSDPSILHIMAVDYRYTVTILAKDVADEHLVVARSVNYRSPLVGVSTEPKVTHINFMALAIIVEHFADGHIPPAIHVY